MSFYPAIGRCSLEALRRKESSQQRFIQTMQSLGQDPEAWMEAATQAAQAGILPWQLTAWANIMQKGN